MIIATFGPTTSLAGKKIEFEEDVFLEPRLAELCDAGKLTDDEFAAFKAKLME